LTVVVPSQVVRLVREHYPQLADHTNLASAAEASFLAGVIAAVKQLPDGIVPADMATRFATTVGSLEAAIQSCTPDARRGHLTGRHISELLSLLAAFPDEPFRPDDSSLQFIDDTAFRRTLSVDIAAAHRALMNGEWKAATVLAGSVIEALCLWVVRHEAADAAVETARRLQREGLLGPRAVPNELLSWHAPELIEVAFALGFIERDTVQVARTTKDYRNLIHPGRELRTGQRCTEGVAHIAIGAMQRVAENLEARHGGAA
jgi:hypothetical protein